MKKKSFQHNTQMIKGIIVWNSAKVSLVRMSHTCFTSRKTGSVFLIKAFWKAYWSLASMKAELILIGEPRVSCQTHHGYMNLTSLLHFYSFVFVSRINFTFFFVSVFKHELSDDLYRWRELVAGQVMYFCYAFSIGGLHKYFDEFLIFLYFL